MKLTENESIFCQALAMTSLLGELSNQKFLDSDYYKKLRFTGNNDIFKEILSKSGIGNPATMQMFLYILLVLPRETLKDFNNKYMNKFEIKINDLCANLVEPQTNSSYTNENDISCINYYRHIRNAVSHGKCFYAKLNNVYYVTFRDDNPNNSGEKCEITLKTFNMGFILEELQRQIMEYLNDRNLQDKNS